MRNEQTISDEIRERYARDPRIPHPAEVAVATTGWLTLRGQVKHQSDSNAAFEAVSALPSVGGISNEINAVTAGGH